MTRRPHDALFKAAFEQPEHAAGLLRSILPASLVRELAWPTLERESGSFVDAHLADRHSDLLFRVELRGRSAFLYLLLEHQSTVDGDMPLRMLVYLVRIWERYRKQHPLPAPLPLIIPTLVSHAPEGWTGPRRFGQMFEPPPDRISGLASLVPEFELLIDDLTLVDDSELWARALAQFPRLALWALRDARDGDKLLAGLANWADAVREVLAAPNGASAILQLLRYVALVGDDVNFEVFNATILEQLPETESITMTIAEQLRAEGHDVGRSEGHAAGRSEGRVEARVDTLLELLALRFGALPDPLLVRVRAGTEAQLQRWIARVLTASSAEAVFTDD